MPRRTTAGRFLATILAATCCRRPMSRAAAGKDLPAMTGNVGGGMQGNTGHQSCLYTADQTGHGADVDIEINTFAQRREGPARHDEHEPERPGRLANQITAGSAVLKDVSVGDQGFEVDIHSHWRQRRVGVVREGRQGRQRRGQLRRRRQRVEAGEGSRRQDLDGYNRLARSPRRVMPSFAYTCAKCVCTVRVEICRCSAIDTSLLPPAASAAICRSRPVNGTALGTPTNHGELPSQRARKLADRAPLARAARTSPAAA